MLIFGKPISGKIPQILIFAFFKLFWLFLGKMRSLTKIDASLPGYSFSDNRGKPITGKIPGI
jgi:hypothetical protein